MNHCPVDGRQNATSVLPSPVKSAGTSLSVAVPNWRAPLPPFDDRRYHHSPTLGRKIEMSVLPSPSKSNGEPPDEP
ncbi:MAG: hypothetical protein IPP63_11570 [Chloracidobacterium sp.]|nr:hypothetical protein [Chloracidobacterium sp.]